MDWTVGTFGTVGNDALDARDCLSISWTLGSAYGTKTRIVNKGGFRPEPDKASRLIGQVRPGGPHHA
ncbi:hypothetical protein J3R75_000311 [Oligosphaera ethanolica]|uniref:Uncharacterized protein n=1 Tax=Oligosphaera ethanolica TaxID=760260 RepID=A0AAE4ALE8_9BACT|nr:hypothetical protein [Oligosphaera ethanolica]